MNQNPEKTKESGEGAADNQVMPGGVIRVDEDMIRSHLDKVVVSTVGQTLNAMLDVEAALLCKAGRHEHTGERVDTRAGHYERHYHTKAGEVTLRMPKLRKPPFETAIMERYRRRESSVEEALVEMYPAGVSVRRVEDITEALRGGRVSPSALSEPNQKTAVQIDAWRARPDEGKPTYVYLDGIRLKRGWGGEVKNVDILVAAGVNAEGHREVPAVEEARGKTKPRGKTSCEA
jgi:transposase-like protein